MNPRLWTIGVVIALFSSAAFADGKPPMDIAVYPKGETTLEVNMTSEELLPMLEAMYPMVAARLGSVAENVTAKDIVAALKGLKRIEALQMQIDAKEVSEQDVADFYAKNLPKGNWSRVMWQCSESQGTVAVYATHGFENLYAFRITKKAVDDKPTREVMVAKIEGKVDIAKLAALAGKVFGRNLP
ncbi:MAG: hypothetical protein A2Z18_09675 [Armatimonadetes bacterium RBG_16_58_9]|nr:MAG: hypothetical protein A2Z18_09675 [Armatimonadetes bacterium RBG_16_58_9]